MSVGSPELSSRPNCSGFAAFYDNPSNFQKYLFRTAVPATVRDIITMRLVKKAKVQKTRWVLAPNLALITWLGFSEWVTKDLGKAALKTGYQL